MTAPPPVLSAHCGPGASLGDTLYGTHHGLLGEVTPFQMRRARLEVLSGISWLKGPSWDSPPRPMAPD